MSGLEKRIMKLEAHRPSNANFVYARAPMDWDDDECRGRAGELLGEYFGGDGFEFQADRADNIKEFEIVLATTGNELNQTLDRIGKQGRRISDGRSNTNTGEKAG